MSIRTPNNLEILLHYYCSSGPHPHIDAPAVQEGVAYLVAEGMLDLTDYPACTDKGAAYIAHLMGVPFPKQVWVIPE